MLKARGRVPTTVMFGVRAATLGVEIRATTRGEAVPVMRLRRLLLEKVVAAEDGWTRSVTSLAISEEWSAASPLWTFVTISL
jgi:hypothetical protein